MIRQLSRSFAVVATGLILGAAGPHAAADDHSQNISSKKRPNFVLFIADDISVDDFGAYGHPTIKTPNIDKLANKGVRFTNAYLTTSSCSPTRTSLLTGRYPHNTGAPELHMEDAPYLKDLPQFPSELKKAGYYTAQAGKWHFNGDASSSFDATYGGRPSGAENWIKSLRERPKDKPFFMWFAANDAHRGWDQDLFEGPHKPKDVVIPPYQVDGKDTREDYARYYDEVHRFDKNIGRVMRELKDQKVFKDTILIVIADNGRPFPRDKTWLYDSGVKTPLVFHYPRRLKTGTQVDGLVSLIDIAPTIAEFAGIEPPETFQGISLMPMLEDPAARVRDYVFAERNWHVLRSHERLVRQGNYVYIRNNIPQYAATSLKNRSNSGAFKELLIRGRKGKLTSDQRRIFDQPRPAEELYDVSSDPYQLNNLADNPAYSQTLSKLRDALDRWSEETGDTVPDVDAMTADRYDRDTWKSVEDKVGHRPKGGEIPGHATEAWKINNPGPR